MQAKKRLFSQSRQAVMNADDAWQPAMAAQVSCPVHTFAVQQPADYRAAEIAHRPDGVDFLLQAGDVAARVRFGIPGQFSVYNALAAIACLCTLGFPLASVVEALAHAQGVKGRAEVVPDTRDFTVVIDYAHTPDGLENICRTLKECCAGRLVTVFGCGGDRDRTKRPKMGRIAAQCSDALVVTSDNPRSEQPAAIIEDILVGVREENTPYTVVENRVEAIRYALEHAQAGDTVLLAGKGHETYQILADGVIHLDEREVVAAVLQEHR